MSNSTGLLWKIIGTTSVLFLAAGPSLVAWGAGGGNPGDAATTSQPAASQPDAAKAAPAPAVPDAVLQELEQLKDAVQAQSQKVAEHTQELDSERATLNDELEGIARLEAKLGIAPAAAPSLAASQPIGPAPVPAAPPENALQPGNQINIVKPENPLSFKIGGADFTPGGFFDLTGIFRNADVGSGLGTNFTTLPYNNTLPLGQLSEFRFTSQGSRLSLKVSANPTPSIAATGYIESDFNGFEPANSNISTKSDSFRLRLAFVQLSHGKWDFLAGQTWTLLTPTREGLSPFPEDIFTALRLDSSYLAGLVYGRQPEFRVVYHATDSWTLAVALENPQQFVPSSVFLPGGASSFFTTQFDNGSSSTTAASAAINPTVPNLHPDIAAKIAFDRRLGGRLLHVEAGGLARSFRVYNNLVSPAATNTITGGGGQLDVNFELFRRFHLIENAFYGDGVGRYIGGLGPDVIVKPDGSLSGIHAGSAIGGVEWQATPRLLFDTYYSGAYFWRNYALTTKALGSPCGVNYCVGFGFPGSANTNNRDYQEATFGVIPTIWSSPNYGKLQFISQFSYVVRTPWYVAAGSPKNAHAFLAYVDLRYIIP
ncbi:MAG: hypothetical protein WA405_12975 [Candidatus Acidiferrales bacterium]